MTFSLYAAPPIFVGLLETYKRPKTVRSEWKWSRQETQDHSKITLINETEFSKSFWLTKSFIHKLNLRFKKYIF